MTAPADTPVATPELLMVAFVISEVLHTPLPVASLKVPAAPVHIVDGPLTVPAPDSGLTVSIQVAVAVPQPLVTVYFMVSVPVDTPVTTPPPVMVAIVLKTLLHTPLPAASVRVTCEATHTLDEPAILPALGRALTVKARMDDAVPQPLVSV